VAISPYTIPDQLTGTMYEFGRYRLTYEPPSDAIEAEVSMSISSEATLPQMIELFQNFLTAQGYLQEGQFVEISDNTDSEPLTGYFGDTTIPFVFK